MTAIVYVIFHFDREVGSSIQVQNHNIKIIIPCSRVHCLEPFVSEQREQAGTTWCHHTHLASLWGAALGRLVPQVSEAPAKLQVVSPNYQAPGVYAEVSSTWDHFQYNKQEKDNIEKTEELQELSRDFRNSP